MSGQGILRRDNEVPERTRSLGERGGVEMKMGSNTVYSFCPKICM